MSRDTDGAPRRRRPTQVADAIKALIVENELRAGDRLPSETELIDHFQMAKSTIREATRILEAQGIVTTRTGPGGGSFVEAVSPDRASALLANYFYFEDLTIDDIYQLRQSLEPELAASLAGRLSEADLAELEAILALYPEPARSAEEERDHHVAALRFHARLAEMAGNRLLGFIIGFMARILTDLTVYRRLYEQPNEALWREGRNHQSALIEALRSGDATGARQIMSSHMRSAHALMEAQAAEVGKRFIV
ncbi:MAG: FCD domain-containing protein [Pseudomonadota bacterium]